MKFRKSKLEICICNSCGKHFTALEDSDEILTKCCEDCKQTSLYRRLLTQHKREVVK